MIRNATFSVIASTVYLLLYCFLLQLEHLRWLSSLMFIFSPAVICWMVYTILKHGHYTGRELADNEEYGYEDK